MAFFTSSNPHFFKIILHHTLIERKLDLPKKFVNNNNVNAVSFLYNKATLRLPDGAKWEVELKKSDGKVSFARGWPEFVEFYSVKAGYFVIFRLEANWCFNVVIFDLSATEINYPMKPRVFRRRRKDHNRGFDRRTPVLVPKSENEDDDDDEDSVQVLNDDVLGKRKREKDQEAAYCSLREMKKMMRKHMKMKHQRFTTPQRFSDEEDAEEDLERNYSLRQSNYRGLAYNYGDGGRSSPESMRPMHPPRTPQPLTENQERVLRTASSFKFRTKNPSFMVTMRPSYIQTGNYLSLPRNFAERYLKESMDVKLGLADGRIWSVWCGVRWAFTRRRTELKVGWKGFAVDNQLHEGDVCVFELVNKIPVVFFRVTIFRLPTN